MIVSIEQIKSIYQNHLILHPTELFIQPLSDLAFEVEIGDYRFMIAAIMNRLEIHFYEVETAISVMREVAAWGREQGYRVWPDEWLTKEELITPDAQPENFCI